MFIDYSLRSEFTRVNHTMINEYYLRFFILFTIIILWHEFDCHCHKEVDSEFEITPIAGPRIVFKRRIAM
jgi:hypothetical protein